MKASRTHRGQGVGFVDVLFNALMGMFLLFVMAMLMVSPVKKSRDIEHKAEIVIIVTWPDRMDTDLDTWVEGPRCGVVSYRRKETCLMTLDRDDLGHLNDELASDTGQAPNQEIVSVRGQVAGMYNMSVHVFRDNSVGVVSDDERKFRVEIIDINPMAQRVFTREFDVGEYKEEMYIASFKVEPDGSMEVIFNQVSVIKKFMSVTQGSAFRA